MKKIQTTKENTKYQRINNIYKLLSNTTVGMSITELASELDVSTKTIQRDLYEVLSEFGAIKEGRYWKIKPQNENDNLSGNERIILGILDELAKNAGKAFYSKAHNLLTQVSHQLEHPIFTGISTESLDEENIELFEKLENAIKTRKEIEFNYEKYDFKVKPLKLAFFDGFWYLLCYDTKSNNTFKKFHLKTIKKLKISNKSFTISENIEEKLKQANSIWFKLDKDPIFVRLLIAPQIKKYFERKPLPSQMIIGEDKDGSIELEIKITDEMEIIPIILYYIPHVKVLEPLWLEETIKKRVSTYLQEL